MAELARGTVLDRPWGRTLGGARPAWPDRPAHGDRRRQALPDRVRPGASSSARSSPLASDAAVRVALTGDLISSTQVADIARRQAAAPGRDEVEVIAEAAQLAPDQALRLRRRLIAQRAARTFAVERGDFVVEDEITLPVVPGSELDVRAIVYLGAQADPVRGAAQHRARPARRLVPAQARARSTTSRSSGSARPSARCSSRWPAAPGSRRSRRPELDQRMVRAVVYALVCVQHVRRRGAPAGASRTPKPAPRRRALGGVRGSRSIPRPGRASTSPSPRPIASPAARRRSTPRPRTSASAARPRSATARAARTPPRRPRRRRRSRR